MSDPADTIARTLRALPDLDAVDQLLHNEADDVLARAFPSEGTHATRAIVGASPEVESDILDADRALRERALDEGRKAVRKIRDHGTDAPLTEAETIGAEAIILMVGRPAILIQDGVFLPPPKEWARLEQHRQTIEQLFHSVGRIEVTGHPELDWIGTGFLVSDQVCMTNRHVAKEFCRQVDGASWAFEPTMSSRIDYAEELATMVPAEFALEEVIGVHDTYDLAVFRVSQTGPDGAQGPIGLPVAGAQPDEIGGHDVYVVGYPAWDGRRNDPEVMQRIFTNIFNVKRLQPGTLIEYFDDRSIVTHDCSTLGGNSGSCVVDLDSAQVTALHFSGRYGQSNEAIALWKLRDDPLLQRAGVNFV